jgi:hypothetical protein
VKTFLVLCALSGVAFAESRVIKLTPVANVGQTLDAFCKEHTDAATSKVCVRNTADSQCHDAQRWDPLGTSVVKEARIVEVHGSVPACLPAVRTLSGWAPFVDGGLELGRKTEMHVERIDVVEPKGPLSYVLFRFAETREHGIVDPKDHMGRAIVACRVDVHGVACGSRSIELGLDAKMREDGKVELLAHRDAVAPGVPVVSVTPAAKAQIGVYDLE